MIVEDGLLSDFSAFVPQSLVSTKLNSACDKLVIRVVSPKTSEIEVEIIIPYSIVVIVSFYLLLHGLLLFTQFNLFAEKSHSRFGHSHFGEF